MKRQNLTPEQYSRANRTMSIILTICYIIYIIVELMKFSKIGSITTSSIVRCGVYALIMVATWVVVKVLRTKKAAMLFCKHII